MLCQCPSGKLAGQGLQPIEEALASANQALLAVVLPLGGALGLLMPKGSFWAPEVKPLLFRQSCDLHRVS